MIFHARNITLENWSLYFETKNPNYLVRFIGKYFEDKLNDQFAHMFNENEIKRINEDQTKLLYLFNKGFNLLPALRASIALSIKSNNINNLKHLFKLFYDYMGREFKSLDDLKSIEEEAAHLQRKYKSILPAEDKTEPKEIRFEYIIFWVERQLSKDNISRSLRLFQFMPYYESAVKISKQKDG